MQNNIWAWGELYNVIKQNMMDQRMLYMRVKRPVAPDTGDFQDGVVNLLASLCRL